MEDFIDTLKGLSGKEYWMLECDDDHVARSIPDAIALLLDKLINRKVINARRMDKSLLCPDCGAPLEEEEIELLERDYPAYSGLMSEAGREAAESKGFFEVDFEGDIVTPLVPGTQECAYTLFEDGNCLCAIERCHVRGGCAFPKPVSCALYPIRIKRLSNGMLALNVHQWDICRDAFEKGRRDGVRVYQFLRAPLIRRFGQDFYDQLLAAADLVLSESD